MTFELSIVFIIILFSLRFQSLSRLYSFSLFPQDLPHRPFYLVQACAQWPPCAGWEDTMPSPGTDALFSV